MYYRVKQFRLSYRNMFVIDFDTIARSISSKNINKEDKEEVFESILKNGFDIYNLKTTLLEIKQEIKNN